jgi:hypothetical protein
MISSAQPWGCRLGHLGVKHIKVADDTMMNPLVRQLQSRDPISDEEKQVLERSIAQIDEFNTGQVIVQAGSHRSESSIIVEGLACRYKSPDISGKLRHFTCQAISSTSMHSS